MFDNFTFAACTRPEDEPQSTSTSLSPHDTSHPGPSSPPSLPVLNVSAGPALQYRPAAKAIAEPHKPAEQPSRSLPPSLLKPTPITDITCQLSTQSITYRNPDLMVSPTSLPTYDQPYAYGLPSPAHSSNSIGSLSHAPSGSQALSPVLEPKQDLDLDVDTFPIVDDDPSAVAPRLSLPRPHYRSTRYMYAPCYPASSDSFHTRRLRRQYGTRLLCDGKLERLVEDLEANASSSDLSRVTHIVNNPLSPPAPTPSSPATAAAGQGVQRLDAEGESAPHPDEGFFDCPSPTSSSADEEEALRAFTMRRAAGPMGISKWRDMGLSISTGGFFRPGDSVGGTKVLSRPRMRKAIGRRKRDDDREGDAGGGPPAANGAV